ncbi:hypothetical protein F4818DRAFT_188364 [Hypoxylon cercidicola]|nr:hypothetical protein F4818DRAFT_188364 [Hypoxylon cercidicola]
MRQKMDVKLSVDGQDGTLIAKSTGLLDVRNNGNGQFQFYDPRIEYQRDGRDGADAPRSVPGSAAGHLSVQLVESPVVKGGIRAIVVASQSSQELPSFVDVPVGRDLLLTAIGGNGEDGMNGEDGGNGHDGVNGVDASEGSDATAGSDGGHGGNAGHGGDGGDGGNGGTIEIIVHEDQAHLLMAVKWDIRGGKGGQHGEHGRPGQGGKKGKGGKGHEWEERIGYVYSCTDRCIGVSNNTSSLVRYKSVLDKSRNLALARFGAQVVTGGNMAMLMTQVATRFNALREPLVTPGACKCQGGQGNCAGCDSEPITRKCKRVEGLDGENGRSGTACTTVIHNGIDGPRGSVTIVVQKSDNSQQEYSSLYSLELVDFDAEDENGDGIFEPGEHLLIRRITVRNSGGMPSPARPIQLNAVESDWFKLVDGDDGHTLLPSIRKGSSVTINSFIKVRIREREEYETLEAGTIFARREAIQLRAIMPWIERDIPKFDFDLVIDIRYPCELRNIQALATVAQASLTKLSFEVYNHGSRTIGPYGDNQRPVEIDISFPEKFGQLLSESGQWNDAVIISPPNIRSRGGLVLKQQLRVHDDAQSYQHVTAVVKLYLGKPTHAPSDGQVDVNPVHIVEVGMQVSDLYYHNPGASFLLVTNSETERERADSIRMFVGSSLGMEIDTWNLSLYAGLDQRDDDSNVAWNILSKYHGKTIIFLGNQFDFFGQGTKSIFDVCDPEVVITAATNNTNFLFLDTPDFKPHETLTNEVVFCSNETVSDTRASINQSHRFDSVADFITAITQQKQLSSLSHARYVITVSKKWHQVGTSKSETVAKNIAEKLQRKLPTDRFLVTFTRPEDSKVCRPDVIVAVGVPYHNSMASLERAAASDLIADMVPTNGIRAAEAYMIVEAIPLHCRVDLLWGTGAGSPSNGDDNFALRSDFAIEALTTSLIQTTHREVELLLDKAPWPDKLLPSNPSKHSYEQLKFLFAAYLPALHAILFHAQALDPTAVVNSNVQLVLSYALAATRPQSKRQIAAQALGSSGHRRQRAHDLLKAGIAILFWKKDMAEIQVRDFFSAADDPTDRDTGAAVLRMVARLTNQSEHAVRKGKQDAASLVRGPLYLGPRDWDSRAAAVKERSKRMAEEGNEARKMLDIIGR